MSPIHRSIRRICLSTLAAALTLVAPAAAVPQSVAWTPSDLSGLEAWFKADAIPAGDRVGDLVSRWPDSAAGSFPVTATSTARPQFVPAAQAGKPVVRFDGVNDGLTRGTSDLLRNSEGGTIFAVRRFSGSASSAARNIAFVATGTAAANARLSIRVGTSSTGGRPEAVARRADADAAAAASVAGAADGAFRIQGGVADFSGGTLRHFLDGTLAGQATLTTGVSSATNALGLALGRSAASAGFFTGDVAEVVIARGTLSNADRERIEGYLAHRWGIASNLPVSHPFRNSPPTVATCGIEIVSAITMSGAADTKSVSVRPVVAACDAWSAASDAAWLSVSPTTGQGEGSLFLTAEANPSATARSATVTVNDRTLVVTQAPACPAGFGWHADLGGLNGEVFALVEFGGELYAGGAFTGPSSGSTTLNRVARWNGSAWVAVGSGFNSIVRTLAVVDGQLHAGGDFTAPGSGTGTLRRVARWNGFAWSELGNGLNARVNALVEHDGTLYAGGEFFGEGSGAPSDIRNIAQWNGTQWTTLGGAGLDNRVLALASFDGRLVATGSFQASTDNLVTSNGLVTWDGTAWDTLGFPEDRLHLGSALAVHDGQLIVGGQEQVSEFDFAARIHRFNPTLGTWSDLGPESGAAPPLDWVVGEVRSLASFAGDLYAAGYFDFGNGGGTFGGFLRLVGGDWTPAGGRPFGTQTGFSHDVHCLAEFGGLLRVGGKFATVGGGQVASRVASWGCGGIADCAPAVSPPSLSFPGSGGTATFDLTVASPGCTWTVDEDETWLSASPATGTGNATVTLTALANPQTGSRSTLVFIGDRMVFVSQAGGCGFALAQPGAFVPPFAGADTVALTAGDPTCSWTASSDVPWITVSPTSGTGAATISYSYTTNAGTEARTGTLTIAGIPFFVTQNGGTELTVNWTPEVLDETFLGPVVEAWYRADTINPDDRVDNRVTRWVDLSGSNHLTATFGLRPVFVPNGLGFKPVVRFDGLDDALSRGATPILQNASGATMYAVRRFNAVPGSTRNIAFVSTPTAANPRLALRTSPIGRAQASARRLDADATASATAGVPVSTSFQIHGAIASFTGGTLSQRVDGSAAGSATVTTGLTSGTQAAGVALGRGVSNTGHMAGDIAEVVIIRRALTASDQNRLEGYLAHEWGLTSSLPLDHPFRFGPPTVECDLALDRSSVSTPASAGSHPLEITTATGACRWTAASDAPWLSINPSSGTGSDTVSLVFAANPTESSRVGTVTVGDLTVTVTQGASCPSGLGWQVPPIGLNGSVHALVEFEGDLIAAGLFTGPSSGPGTLNRVARWNGSQWVAMGTGFNARVRTLAVHGGELFAGGDFTGPGSGSGSLRRVARWTGSSWVEVGTGFNSEVPNGTGVHVLRSFGGELFAGGAFIGRGTDAVGTGTLWRVARWDGSNWLAAGFGFDAPVNAFAEHAGSLVAGGSFGNAGFGGEILIGVASWTGETWVTFGNGLEPLVTSLASYNGRLYAGGKLGFEGNAQIAVLGDSGWEQMLLGVEGPVNSLVEFEGMLLAGGFLLGTANDAGPVAGLMRLDGITWVPFATGVSGSSFVLAMTPFEGRLHVGGGFNRVGGGLDASNVASLGCPGIDCAPTVSPSQPAIGFAGGTATVSLSMASPSCTWLVTEIPSWLSVSPPSGSGSASLVLTAEPNPNAAERVALVQVADRTITVTQAGVTLWEPGDVAIAASSWGIKAWFEADGIELADRSGNLVSTWRDRVVSAFVPCPAGLCPVTGAHDVTATGTARPQFVASGQAGNPVVRFNGTSQSLARGTSGLFRNVTGGTIFVVRKPTAASSLRTVVKISNGTSANSHRAGLEVGSPSGGSRVLGRRTDGNAVQASSSATGGGAAWAIQCGEFNYGAASLRQLLNGSQVSLLTPFQTAGATSDTASLQMTIGRLGAGNFFQGDIAEVLVYHRVLTACQRQAIEGYLAHKWGIAALLPASHPFRAVPPTVLSMTCADLTSPEAGSGEGDAPVPVVLVPQHFASVQEAVDAAPDGAMIVVGPGVHGGFAVSGKSLAIVSEAGVEATVLEGDGRSGSVVTVLDGAEVSLQGVTVRGGFGGTPVDLGDGIARLAGGGVLVRDASVELVGCVLEQNLAGFGGAVAAIDAEAVLDGCTIRGNHAAHDGGGLWFRSSLAALVGGEIAGNVAGGEGGGLWVDAASTVTVEATATCGNEPEQSAGEVDGEFGGCDGCRADLDGDGLVGAGDLAALMADWGGASGDLDGDGEVGGADLAVLLEAWDLRCGGR